MSVTAFPGLARILVERGLGRTPLGALASLVEPALWPVALVVPVAAVVGKLGGSAVAARAGGVPWREAAALGVLMNTRGLMAFLTTIVTSPLLSALGIPARAAAA